MVRNGWLKINPFIHPVVSRQLTPQDVDAIWAQFEQYEPTWPWSQLVQRSGGWLQWSYLPAWCYIFWDGLKGCWWPPTKGSKGHGLNHLVGTHTKRVKWSNLTNMFFFNYVLPFCHIANDSWLKWWVCRGWWITGWWVYKWSLTNILQMNQQSTASVRNYYCCQYYHPPKTNTAWKVPSSIGNIWIHWCYFFSCQPHVRFREGRFVTQFDGWEKWNKDIATNWWWIPWLLIIWKVLWTDFPVFGRGLVLITPAGYSNHHFFWLTLLVSE